MSSDTSKASVAASSASTAPSGPPPISLDCGRANTGVWLVKVPNYLAKKWTEAPENSEVGMIQRITQTKGVGNIKPKQEVVFHLNEALGQTATIKIGNTTLEQKIPLAHKFLMTPLGSQDIYILRQSEENSKEMLSVIGKVKERAECTPVQNDSNYFELKRETMKQYTEPKRQIKIASQNIIRTSYLPKSVHTEKAEVKSKVKRIRKDKEEVLDMLFNAFSKHQYYNIKDLVKLTQQPSSYLKLILHEICKFNVKGMHKNAWELKEEYKQSGLNTTESKKKAAASLAKNVDPDQYMDDEDEDEDDFDDVDDFDDEDEEFM